MKQLIAKILENAISYPEYRTLVHDLLSVGKSTGPIQSEALTNYSLLNDRRMKRLDKTIKISDETKAVFKSITEKQTWLVLTEGWCGDAAQNLPVIQKLAAENENIALKIVLRDEYLELMDLFLTNGGRSIPKVIVLDAQNNVQHTWGPRPTLATEMMTDYKAKNGSIDAQFKQDLQVWYNKNKGQSVQEDFVNMQK
ncbi:MAG: thioredoxin family protein [Polaribacter sp.]